MATRTTLKTKFAHGISGKVDDTSASLIINDAVNEVVSDINLASMHRRTALSPSLFDKVYQYTFPVDAKDNGLIDIVPQINRDSFDDWRLTTFDEFDRIKGDTRLDSYGDPVRLSRNRYTGENIVAIDKRDLVNRLLISKPVDDKAVTIDAFNSLGTWTAVGDAETLVADSSNYVEGSASLKFNINAGGTTTAGVVNTTVTTFDVTEYLTEGSCFVWAYISNATDITNFILKVGSSSTAYYSMTATTTNEGASFAVGWNLIRFSFSGKSTTGTPDDDLCVYVSLYMTKAAGKISQTGFRFDNLIMVMGVTYDVLYYSKYAWTLASGGARAAESAADGDTLNFEYDELKVLEYKYRELAEGFLRNFGMVEQNRQLYENQKNQYLAKNTDESLTLETTYYNTFK